MTEVHVWKKSEGRGDLEVRGGLEESGKEVIHINDFVN